MPRWIQAFASCLLLFARANAFADPPADDQELTARLRAECDALLRVAVVKPYGTAWPAPDGDQSTLPRGANLVSLDPLSTPSVGLMLLWAGRSLGEEKYVHAAHHAARGIAVSLQHSGRVPSRVVFDTSVRPRDTGGGAFPDRAPTYAGLALMLSVVDDGAENTLVRSAAARASTFLTRQQTGSGAWAVVVSKEGDDEKEKDSATNRQIPLHTTDYRDGTLALLYAYEVLGDVPLRKAVESAIDQLIKLRITRSKSATGLWHGAYNLSNQPLPGDGETYAVDSLATRHALQTLFAVHVVLGGDSTITAIEETANQLVALRYPQGQWDRHYPMTKDEVRKKETGPDQGSTFANPAEPAQLHGDFGLPPLLNAIGKLQQSGRAKYLEQSAKALSHKQQLALTLCGLSDSPLTPDLPTTREEAKAYSEANRERWDRLDSGGVADTETRVRRIHALLIRRHVNKLFTPPPAAAPDNPGN